MRSGTAPRDDSCPVLEAVRVGVHEFLLKPVSSNALLARVVSALTKPRPMGRCGHYCGPEPRKLAAYKPELESYNLDTEKDPAP